MNSFAFLGDRNRVRRVHTHVMSSGIESPPERCRVKSPECPSARSLVRSIKTRANDVTLRAAKQRVVNIWFRYRVR